MSSFPFSEERSSENVKVSTDAISEMTTKLSSSTSPKVKQTFLFATMDLGQNFPRRLSQPWPVHEYFLLISSLDIVSVNNLVTWICVRVEFPSPRFASKIYAPTSIKKMLTSFLPICRSILKRAIGMTW